jgi:biotin carboxylase
MRELLREKGVDSTSARLVKNAEDIANFGKLYGYPIVLKPVDGRGSLGVSIIRTVEDIALAINRFEKWSCDKQMLVEQFLNGDEYSVETFSEQGQHRVVCITQKFKDPMTCIETGHCLPAPLPKHISDEIQQFVIRMLTVIGIENGPAHTEIIVTSDGRHIVETHARLAGDNIVELIQLTTGVDLDDAWIRQSAGEKVLDKIPTTFEKHASISFVTPNAVGTLERLEGVTEALSQPGVVSAQLVQAIGAHLEGAHDSNTRGAYAIAIGNNAEEATKRARDAASRLKFIISCKG